MKATAFALFVLVTTSLIGCASEQPPAYAVKAEDKAFIEHTGYTHDPQYALVHCIDAKCYNVYTGEAIEVESPPDGFMLTNAAALEGQQ